MKKSILQTSFLATTFGHIMSWCFVTHLPNKRTWPWNFYFFCFQEQFFFSQSSFLSPGCVFAEIEMSPVFYFISSSSIPLLVHTGNVEKVVLMNDFLHEHPFWRWTCSVPDQKRLKSHSKYTWHFLYFSARPPPLTFKLFLIRKKVSFLSLMLL